MPEGRYVWWTASERLVAVLTGPARLTGVLVQRFLDSRVVGTALARANVVEARLVRGLFLLPAGGLLAWLAPPYYKAFGVLVIFVAVWLIYSDPLDGKAEVPPHRQVATMVGGRGLVLVAGNSLVGFLVWQAVVSPSNPLTLRLFTLWGVVHFCLLWLAWASFVDCLAERLGQRIFNGVLLLLGLAALENHSVELGEQACEPQISWFDLVEDRLDSMGGENEPVIAVAAAGGGSRAALYATLVLEAMERTPTEGDIGGWGELEEGDESLAGQVLFLSSVSGGSVASAHWAHGGSGGLVPRADEDSPGEISNTIRAELQQTFVDELVYLCQDAEGLRQKRLCSDHPDGRQEDDRWPLESQRFDDLSSDFTAPLVRGILLPGVERGESMTHFWQQQFGWNTRAKEGWLERRSGPILLVNITDVESGKRVVAGEPRLPRGLLTSGLGGKQARGMSDYLDEGRCVSLEESVRMSANFPWGFGLPSLGNQTLRAIDGGVLDNTGIDTLAILIERLAYLANHATGQQYEELHLRAADLMDRLATRGMIVVEIDSGAKPEPPGLVANWFAGVFLPVHSLSASSYSRAVATTSANVSRIERALSSWAQRQVATGQHDIPHAPHTGELEDTCSFAEGTESTNLDVVGARVRHVVYALDTDGIMTSWALTPEQKGQVLARFLHEDALQRTALKDAYEDMRGSNAALDHIIGEAKVSPDFADLMETLAWDRRELQRLEEAAIVEHTAVRMAALTDEELAVSSVHADVGGWAYVGFWNLGGAAWEVSPLSVGANRDHPMDVGSRVMTEQPLLVRNSPPEREQGGWELPQGLIDSPSCVEVAQIAQWSEGLVFAELLPLEDAQCR